MGNVNRLLCILWFGRFSEPHSPGHASSLEDKYWNNVNECIVKGDCQKKKNIAERAITGKTDQQQKGTESSMAEKLHSREGSEYLPLNCEDLDGESDNNPLARPSGSSSSAACFHWLQRLVDLENRWKRVSIVLTVLLIGNMALLLRGTGRSLIRSPDVSGYICAPNGAIPEVARARGCEFDGLSFHWFPKEHTEDEDNQALLQEFEDSGPWHRYLDKEGRYEIPSDNLVLKAAYLTRNEHIVHCKYALRQTHLWVTKGWDVPFSYNHTVHCTGYLVDTIMYATEALRIDEYFSC